MNTLVTLRILVSITFLVPSILWLVLQKLVLMIQEKNGKKWAEKLSINMIWYQWYTVVSELFKLSHLMIVQLFLSALLPLLIQLQLLIIWFKTLDTLWMVHHGSTFSYITQFISMVTWLLLMNIATCTSISHNFKCFLTSITDSWVNWEPDFPWFWQITCKQSCSISGTFLEHIPNLDMLTGTWLD